MTWEGTLPHVHHLGWWLACTGETTTEKQQPWPRATPKNCRTAISVWPQNLKTLDTLPSRLPTFSLYKLCSCVHFPQSVDYQLNPFCKQGKGWDLFVMGHLSSKAFLMSWITPIICSQLSSPPRTALDDHIWGDFYRAGALTTMHYFWAKASDKLLGQLGHISDESETRQSCIHDSSPGTRLHINQKSFTVEPVTRQNGSH